MANKAVITKFNNVSGWSGGPLKPSTSVSTGSASAVKSDITSAIANIGDLSGAECIQIIITHED